MRIITKNGVPIGKIHLEFYEERSHVARWLAKEARGEGVGTSALKEISEIGATWAGKEVEYVTRKGCKKSLFKGLLASVALKNEASLKSNFKAGWRIQDYEIEKSKSGVPLGTLTFSYPPTTPAEKPFMPRLKEIEKKIIDSEPEVKAQGWEEYKAFVEERLSEL